MSIIVHGVAQTGTSGTFTTPSFTSTGGGGLGVAGVSSHAGTATLSDNKGNTWTKYTSQELGTTGINPSVQLYYCEAPTVGSGHTLTVTGASEFQCVEYAFLSDVLVHDGTNARGQVSPGGPTVAPGSTTPSAANAWLFSAAASGGGNSYSIDASFTIIDSAGTIGGTAYGGALASKTLTTASAQNPTWTADSFGSAVIGAFIPGGPSAQTVNPNAIATAESVYAPTVTGGGVSPLSVTPDAVATGEVVFAPTVNTTGSGWGYRAGSFAAQASGFSSSGASFTTTLTLGAAVLTGDRIIVAVYAVQSTSGAAPTYSLRDNVNGAGAAYTEDHTRTGTIASGGTQNLRHSVFSLANSAAGTPTITVTLTAGAGGGGTPIFGGVVAAAWSGLLTSDPGSDVKTGNSATSSSSASWGLPARPRRPTSWWSGRMPMRASASRWRPVAATPCAASTRTTASITRRCSRTRTRGARVRLRRRRPRPRGPLTGACSSSSTSSARAGARQRKTRQSCTGARGSPRARCSNFSHSEDYLMGYRITVLGAENVTVGTGNVLMAVQTAAAATTAAGIVKIKRLEISQNGSTTLAMIRAEMATRNLVGTLTTTSTTPQNLSPIGGGSGLTGSGAPAGGAARTGTNSSADSGGTYTSLMPFNFANTAGYLYKPDPDEEIYIPPGVLFVVRFLAAPSTTSGWTFSMILGENV